jgi:hypothetical protein
MDSVSDVVIGQVDVASRLMGSVEALSAGNERAGMLRGSDVAIKEPEEELEEAAIVPEDPVTLPLIGFRLLGLARIINPSTDAPTAAAVAPSHFKKRRRFKGSRSGYVSFRSLRFPPIGLPSLYR